MNATATASKPSTRRRLGRHCGQHRAHRPRRLCWSCYYNPAVRARYPSKVVLGHADFYGAAPDGEPTAFPPGSMGKVLVLEKRARRGLALFHDDDAPAAA